MKENNGMTFGDLRRHVEDLFVVKPVIYWIDFLSCMVLAWGSFLYALRIPWHHGLSKGFWLSISTLAFFRGLIFTHEMVHIRATDLPGFRWAWNALCGMFCFLPDYTYRAHADHHGPNTFSTREDPEYLPLVAQRFVEILGVFLVFPFIPIVMAFRFLIAGPLSLMIGGPFREWLLRNASTLKMNPLYQWADMTEEDRALAKWQDGLCFVWWLGFLGICRVWLGWQTLWQFYGVLYGILIVNHFRSLARHRYVNITGEKVSYETQILDSVCVAGFSPAATLLMPVGLRYHSTHHMFPTLPYYALGKAHQRLVGLLPEDHPYMKTRVSSFSMALWNFVKTVRSGSNPLSLRPN